MVQEPAVPTKWFFVDESGDPCFYDRNGNLIVGLEDGSSPILVIGFVETESPEEIRAALAKVRDEIRADPYVRGIPSLEWSLRSFHAKDDCSEVRERVYRAIPSMEFKAQFMVARKIERVFRNSFHCDETRLYDHLVTQLFRNVLHRATTNRIYFAKRGNRDRQAPLSAAISRATESFRDRHGVEVKSASHVQSQTPVGEPVLQLIDYMNWAVYRAFVRREMRFFDFVREKVSLLVDLYDKERYPKNWYDRRNIFEIEKISPLRLGPGTGRTA